MPFERISTRLAGRPRPILAASDERLRRQAKYVTRDEMKHPLFAQMLADLHATVAANGLVGMAAPQVGVLQQIIVIDFLELGQHHGPYTIINPRIEMSEGSVLSTEGSPCLPEVAAEILRADHVMCSGLNEQGKRQVLDARGMLAICIQHEVDHLAGVLISDRAQKLVPIASVAGESQATPMTLEADHARTAGSPFL